MATLGPIGCKQSYIQLACHSLKEGCLKEGWYWENNDLYTSQGQCEA